MVTKVFFLNIAKLFPSNAVPFSNTNFADFCFSFIKLLDKKIAPQGSYISFILNYYRIACLKLR